MEGPDDWIDSGPLVVSSARGGGPNSGADRIFVIALATRSEESRRYVSFHPSKTAKGRPIRFDSECFFVARKAVHSSPSSPGF